jgi:hypothetical protein
VVKEEFAVRDLMRQCVTALRDNGAEVTIHDAVNAFKELYPSEYEENRSQWADEGLSARFRTLIKRHSSESKVSEQLRITFRLSDVELPGSIAIPELDGSSLSDRKTWKAMEEVTIPELDAHLQMLQDQIKADSNQLRSLRKLRQAVVAVIGEGSALTVGEAAIRVISEQ